MDTASLISRLRRADPDRIRARLAELAAEEKALRELLRIVRRAKPEPLQTGGTK